MPPRKKATTKNTETAAAENEVAAAAAAAPASAASAAAAAASSAGAPASGTKRKHAASAAAASEHEDEDGARSDTHQASNVEVKKARIEEAHPAVAAASALVSSSSRQQALITAAASQQPRGPLLAAPALCLTGHGAAVFSVAFSPSGSLLASAGADNNLFLWSLQLKEATAAPAEPGNGSVSNTAVLRGLHTAAILDCAWSPHSHSWGSVSLDTRLYTASADHTLCVVDVEQCEKFKRLRGHKAVVNSVCVNRSSTELVLTSSDDGTVKLFDLRSRHPSNSFEQSYPMTAAVFSDDGQQIFCGGIANDIQCLDLKTGHAVYTLKGHRDTITGLSLSPDGSFLLSNALDSTLRMWDVRPFCSNPTRQSLSLSGHTHDMQQNLLRCGWSCDGSKVSAGSADGIVNVWSATSGELLSRLPGHRGAVHSVAFHPRYPILASCSSDKTMWIGEI